MNICIITPSKDVYSETFIRAHIERLPGVKSVLSGGTFPVFDQQGRHILPAPGVFVRVMRSILRRSLGLPYDYFSKRSLYRLLIREKIDVVLAEYGFTGDAVADVCNTASIPVCVHFHGFDAYRHDLIANGAYDRLFKEASMLIVVSRAMKQQLQYLGAPSEKVAVNSCGVDINVFQPTSAGTSSPHFLAVGRFVDKKAPYLTLLAFNEVRRQIPDARLIMLGDGPLLEVCWRIANALGICPFVDLKGVTTPKSVVEEMHKARAFVQHSLRPEHGPNMGDSEGTPVAILEAMASGLPVVATRHAGIEDAVADGESGFLVDEGDMHGMAAKMLLLAADPELATRMGMSGRMRAESNYSMAASISRLEQILFEAFASSHVSK